MAQFIEFDAGTGRILVEVDETETSRADGTIKAGLREKVRDSVTTAQASFEDALTLVIRANAQLFVDAVEGLDRPPSRLELSFGVKATGELGNFAVAKAGGEASYTVSLTWDAAAR